MKWYLLHVQVVGEGFIAVLLTWHPPAPVVLGGLRRGVGWCAICFVCVLAFCGTAATLLGWIYHRVFDTVASSLYSTASCSSARRLSLHTYVVGMFGICVIRYYLFGCYGPRVCSTDDMHVLQARVVLQTPR